MTKYVFKEGRRVKGVDAQTVGEELEAIRERDGDIKTESIIEAARPKEAPLHPAFEWRDKVAAEAYRLEQARRLVRSVRVVTEPTENRTEPAFVHVAPETGKGPGYYQAPSVVAQNLDEYERALSAALGKLKSAQQAVDDLRAAAQHSEHPERAAQIAVILETLSVASRSLSQLH